MLPTPLQFIIAIIAYAINQRMARRIDYLQEEVRVLKEALAAATGKTRIERRAAVPPGAKGAEAALAKALQGATAAGWAWGRRRPARKRACGASPDMGSLVTMGRRTRSRSE
jgi:hypothetical protein